jgi:hypothetical protein
MTSGVVNRCVNPACQSTAGCVCQTVWLTPPKRPHKCPACDGSTKISRPPHVAGDVLAWDGTGNPLYDCVACGATGVVWG